MQAQSYDLVVSAASESIDRVRCAYTRCCALGIFPLLKRRACASVVRRKWDKLVTRLYLCAWQHQQCC